MCKHDENLSSRTAACKWARRFVAAPSRDEIGRNAAVAFQVQTTAGRAWRLSNHLGTPHGRARDRGVTGLGQHLERLRTGCRLSTFDKLSGSALPAVSAAVDVDQGART